MQGRVVVLDTGWQTVSAAQDLVEAKMGAAQAGYVLRAKVMQSSDEAASEAEQLQVNLKRATGSFTSGSGGGSATAVKGQSGDAAHGLAAAERNNTTQAAAGAGALETLEPGAFNVLAGEWEFAGTPELMWPVGPSEAAVLSLDEAPADALTLRATLTLLLTHG
jgi:hypothetical protein